jgi:hypothetical protein
MEIKRIATREYVPTIDDMGKILEENPYLDAGSYHQDEWGKLHYLFGFERSKKTFKECREELKEKYLKYRKEMLDKQDMKEFQYSCWWLAKLNEEGVIKTPNYNSYGLKHIAENHRGRYISNGNMIAAAFYLGLKWSQGEVDRGNPNIEIAIPKKNEFWKYTHCKSYGNPNFRNEFKIRDDFEWDIDGITNKERDANDEKLP